MVFLAAKVGAKRQSGYSVVRGKYSVDSGGYEETWSVFLLIWKYGEKVTKSTKVQLSKEINWPEAKMRALQIRLKCPYAVL